MCVRCVERHTVTVTVKGGKMNEIKKTKLHQCCLCNLFYEGYGNNAQPIKEGQCCDKCNQTKVIPARLIEIIRRDKQ